MFWAFDDSYQNFPEKTRIWRFLLRICWFVTQYGRSSRTPFFGASLHKKLLRTNYFKKNCCFCFWGKLPAQWLGSFASSLRTDKCARWRFQSVRAGNGSRSVFILIRQHPLWGDLWNNYILIFVWWCTKNAIGAITVSTASKERITGGWTRGDCTAHSRARTPTSRKTHSLKFTVFL